MSDVVYLKSVRRTLAMAQHHWKQWLVLGLMLLSNPVAMAQDLRLQGQAIQGGLIIGYSQPGCLGWLDEQALMLSREGVFVFGFGRDAAKQSTLRLQCPGEGVVEHALEVARREYRVQHIDGLPPAMVTPPQALLERIRSEARQVRAARARRDHRTDFLAGFQWPAEGPVSGVYGSQRVLNGEPRRPHYGLDIAAHEGAPVHAPAAGMVTLAEPDLYYSGGTLIIDHGHGLSSTFLHLSKVEVAAGQRVAQGQLIARVGATGRATGAHLDWRMNWGDVRVDPQLLLPTASSE